MVTRSTVCAAGLLAVGVLGCWPWGGLNFGAGKLALFELGLLLVIAGLIRTAPLRWFVWWALLGAVLVYDWRSIVTCWRLVLGAGALEVIARTSDRQEAPALLAAWRWVTIVHTTLMLVQPFGGLEWLVVAAEGQAPRLATGLIGNTMLAGAYTAMTLPLFQTGRWRWWWLPSLVAVWLTHSVGALLITLLLGSLVFRALRPRPRLLVSAFLVSLVITLHAPLLQQFQTKVQEEPSNRLLVWGEAERLRMRSTRTEFFGYGPGQFARVFRQQAQVPPPMRWKTAHSEPLQVLFEFGWVGALLVTICLMRWWLEMVWNPAPAVQTVGLILIAWVLASGYGFPAHVPALAVVLIVCGGVLEGARRHRMGLA